MARLKKDLPKKVKSILSGPKAESHLGDVNYYPFPEVQDEPFRLYFDGNPLFEKYGNIPLTVMELRQKVITKAAESFRCPVWFDCCIDDEGTFLPFAMVTDRFPGGLAIPTVLNAEIAPKDTDGRTWAVIARAPLDHRGGFLEVKGYIRYAWGHVLDANDVWEGVLNG